MWFSDFISGIWGLFTPPDPPVSDFFSDPMQIAKVEGHFKAQRNWSLKVSGTLACFVILVILSVTRWGFVRAADFQSKLDTAVQQTVISIAKEQQSVKNDVASIKMQNDQMALALREILRAQTANTICRILNNKVADAAARAQRRADADNEQEKYKATTGDYYPESRCGSGQ
jgi:hypothetical protein